jgi:hypothetical protein
LQILQKENDKLVENQNNNKNKENNVARNFAKLDI